MVFKSRFWCGTRLRGAGFQSRVKGQAGSSPETAWPGTRGDAGGSAWGRSACSESRPSLWCLWEADLTP